MNARGPFAPLALTKQPEPMWVDKTLVGVGVLTLPFTWFVPELSHGRSILLLFAMMPLGLLATGVVLLISRAQREGVLTIDDEGVRIVEGRRNTFLAWNEIASVRKHWESEGEPSTEYVAIVRHGGPVQRRTEVRGFPISNDELVAVIRARIVHCRDEGPLPL